LCPTGGEIQVLAKYARRDAVAALAGVGAAGEDGCYYFTVGVYGRSAGVSGTDVDAEAGDGPFHWTASIGIRGDDAPRIPGPSGLYVEWATFGEAENGYSLAYFGLGEWQGRESQTWNSQDGYVVGGVEEYDVGSFAAAYAARLDSGRVFARDDVGVGDYEVRGGDPARAFDAVAAGYPLDAHEPGLGRQDLRVALDARVRARDIGFGTPDLG
jgi:hypothetical protein